ncbi:MAG: response regulator [Thermaurantimonas sp.]|uniref:response regulator transcription factor n=1 Tax=Thermaurantimonas sp. TaxID=2681568 RepID=UPI00391D8C1B
MNKIRVVLADDNAYTRISVQRNLSLIDDIELVFTASNARELIHFLRRTPNIHLVLMDVEMPEVNGIEAAEKIKSYFPHIKVVMFTVFDDEEVIYRAVKAGASGYILKDASPETLATGIRNAYNHNFYYSEEILKKSVELLRKANLSNFDSKSEKSEEILTSRESELMVQLSRGLSNAQIAHNLGISEGTVRKHLENIYRKLQVHNKVEAVIKFRQK